MKPIVSSPPEVSKRLWVIQNPLTWEIIGIHQSHRPEEACNAIARLLKMPVRSFRATTTPSGHKIDKDGGGETVFATDISRLVEPAVALSLTLDQLADLARDAEDGDSYVAPCC